MYTGIPIDRLSFFYKRNNAFQLKSLRKITRTMQTLNILEANNKLMINKGKLKMESKNTKWPPSNAINR